MSQNHALTKPRRTETAVAGGTIAIAAEHIFTPHTNHELAQALLRGSADLGMLHFARRQRQRGLIANRDQAIEKLADRFIKAIAKQSLGTGTDYDATVRKIWASFTEGEISNG